MSKVITEATNVSRIKSLAEYAREFPCSHSCAKTTQSAAACPEWVRARGPGTILLWNSYRQCLNEFIALAALEYAGNIIAELGGLRNGRIGIIKGAALLDNIAYAIQAIMVEHTQEEIEDITISGSCLLEASAPVTIARISCMYISELLDHPEISQSPPDDRGYILGMLTDRIAGLLHHLSGDELREPLSGPAEQKWVIGSKIKRNLVMPLYLQKFHKIV